MKKKYDPVMNMVVNVPKELTKDARELGPAFNDLFNGMGERELEAYIQTCIKNGSAKGLSPRERGLWRAQVTLGDKILREKRSKTKDSDADDREKWKKIIQEGKTISAKTEEEAVRKLNRELASPKGFGTKIKKYKDSYYHKYILAVTLDGRSHGHTVGVGFSLAPNKDKTSFTITRGNSKGYGGQDAKRVEDARQLGPAFKEIFNGMSKNELEAYLGECIKQGSARGISAREKGLWKAQLDLGNKIFLERFGKKSKARDGKMISSAALSQMDPSEYCIYYYRFEQFAEGITGASRDARIYVKNENSGWATSAEARAAASSMGLKNYTKKGKKDEGYGSIGAEQAIVKIVKVSTPIDTRFFTFQKPTVFTADSKVKDRTSFTLNGKAYTIISSESELSVSEKREGVVGTMKVDGKVYEVYSNIMANGVTKLLAKDAKTKDAEVERTITFGTTKAKNKWLLDNLGKIKVISENFQQFEGGEWVIKYVKIEGTKDAASDYKVVYEGNGFTVEQFKDRPMFFVYKRGSKMHESVFKTLEGAKKYIKPSTKDAEMYRQPGTNITNATVNSILYNILEDARRSGKKSEVKKSLTNAKAILKKFPNGGDENTVSFSTIKTKLAFAENKFKTMDSKANGFKSGKPNYEKEGFDVEEVIERKDSFILKGYDKLNSEKFSETISKNKIDEMLKDPWVVWKNGTKQKLMSMKTKDAESELPFEVPTSVASKKEFKRLESVFQENLAEMRRYSELINQAIKRQNPNGSEIQKYRYEFSKLAAKNERIKREIKQYMNTHFSAL